MGEAKRKRGRGIDMARVAKEVVEALNSEAGAAVWSNMRSKAWDGDALLDNIYYISGPGADMKVMPTSDIHDRSGYRYVVVALVRHGSPWIATHVIDKNPKYVPDVYASLGAWASDIATPMVADQSRVPSTSMILHTDWPDDDLSLFDRYD